MGENWGRLGRAGAVYASAGLLWWVAIGVTGTVVSCGDWGCLYPSVALDVLITVGVLVAMVPLLRRVDVGPAWPVARWAAGALLFIRIFGEAVPATPSTLLDLLGTGAAFGAAGVIGALTATPGLGWRWRWAVVLGVLALPLLALAVVWPRDGF